jgi:very-short-patch-repair endonuclease
VLPELPPAERLAVRAHAVLSHTSAAQRLGLTMLLPVTAVHLTVRHRARVTARPNVVHHRRDLPATDIDGLTTTAVRTVLDCAATLAFAEGLAIADGALREARVRRPQLERALIDSRMRGVATARTVVAAADPGAANPFESALRAVLIQAGIDGFATQVVIRTSRLTARVDLADESRRLVLEADSYTHHGATRADFADDCRRYNELVRAGWTVLRFSWEDVMFYPAQVADAVRDVQRRLAATQRRRTAPSVP